LMKIYIFQNFIDTILATIYHLSNIVGNAVPKS